MIVMPPFDSVSRRSHPEQVPCSMNDVSPQGAPMGEG
jgi:hypothetical protein